MTIKTKTYAQQQATELLDTGRCQLPVDWQDIAHKVAQMDNFAYALQQFHLGRANQEPAKLRMLEMLVVTATHNLCQEQDNAS